VIWKTLKEVLYTLIFAHDKNKVHGSLYHHECLILMWKNDIPHNFNDLEKGTHSLLKNIDTFKSYETIEFEHEEDD